MMNRNLLLHSVATLAFVGVGLVPALALAGKSAAAPKGSAAPTSAVSCTDSLVTDSLAHNPSFVDCTGAFQGNMSETSIMFGADTFAFIGKTENNGTGDGPFQAFGADFKGGTLTFDDPWVGTFVLGLKAGNDYSLYRFHSDTGVASIDFDTLGVAVNTNGIGLGLSHVNLYGGEPFMAPPIPEPSTYAFMLAGLGVVSLVARRRRPGA